MENMQKHPRVERNKLVIGQIVSTDHFDLLASASEEIDALAASTGEPREDIIARNQDEIARDKQAIASGKTPLEFLTQE